MNFLIKLYSCAAFISLTTPLFLRSRTKEWTVSDFRSIKKMKDNYIKTPIGEEKKSKFSQKNFAPGKIRNPTFFQGIFQVFFVYLIQGLEK